MPREFTGLFTLVSGNPVVAGTIIESEWANTTLPDIAQGLSDSLSRTGLGHMAAPLLLTSGTIGVPSLAYIDEPSLGSYRPEAGRHAWVAGGFHVADYTEALWTFGLPVVLAGNAVNPLNPVPLQQLTTSLANIDHDTLLNVTADQHHPQAHIHDGLDGSGTVLHADLIGMTTDDHHNQVHLLFGADHSDVVISTPMAQEQGLLWDGSAFTPQYRGKYVEFINGNTYYPQQAVYLSGWLTVANKETMDYPVPIGVGDYAFVYGGTSPTRVVADVKQVLFGNRYTWGEAGYLSGYRVYVVSGNEYNVSTVSDPLGVPIYTEVSQFTATTTGWLNIPTATALILPGSVFDLVVTTAEPDPVPTEFNGNWNYVTPNNPLVPTTGQISQANNQLDQLRVHYIDNDGGDRTAAIQALGNGDIVTDGVTRWSIQNNADQGGVWAILTVAPATQSGADGVKNFIFETTAPASFTIMEDVNWWGVNPVTPPGLVQGLYIEDGSYGDVVPDTNAYGADIAVQSVTQSPDWDIFGAPGGSGAAGGGDFVPELFTGAGSSGYVPDPITETGKLLFDNGLWADPPQDLSGNLISVGEEETIVLSDDGGTTFDTQYPLSTLDISIYARTQNNSTAANALVQLDAFGLVPLDLLPVSGYVLQGFWNPDPGEDGPTPPVVIVNSGFYTFDNGGDMTLFESTDQTAHTVVVSSRDIMVGLVGAAGYVDGWYYVPAPPLTVIPATDVTVDVGGTIYTGPTAQDVFEEQQSLFLQLATGGVVTGGIQIVPPADNIGYSILDSGGGFDLRTYANGDVTVLRAQDPGGGGGHVMFQGQLNAGTSLWFSAFKKFETRADGVNITGDIFDDGVNINIIYATTAALNGYLPLVGGQMTGNITFQADPLDAIRTQFLTDGGGYRMETEADGEVFFQQLSAAGGDEFGWMKFFRDGAVQLYHAGDVKFATRADGVNVTGDIFDDGANINTIYATIASLDGYLKNTTDTLKGSPLRPMCSDYQKEPV